MDESTQDTKAMDERNPPSPGRDGAPLPRDLPDQQASDGPDPWDVDEETAATGNAPDSDDDVPDTDEGGTGRRGTPHPDASGAGGPQPEESSG
ncbi:hypothetical protein ACFWZ2_39640 [Streptomyces sp. NPDC059002]|uniref:hypothetical protein n=1 Tax=Streptomyces sp. NPDC059002 TaxID=3346690 RepID=UPI0036B8B330